MDFAQQSKIQINHFLHIEKMKSTFVPEYESIYLLLSAFSLWTPQKAVSYHFTVNLYGYFP